jgi:hypothetical protein
LGAVLFIIIVVGVILQDCALIQQFRLTEFDYLLAFELSILLKFTASNFPYGIFKQF